MARSDAFVSFAVAAVIFTSGIAVAQQAQLATDNERRAVIQTSCAKVYTDAADPSASCSGVGVGAGAAFSLNVAYAASATTGRPLYSSLNPYDATGQPRDTVPAIFSIAGDVKFGDIDVSAGTYSLYMISSANGWQLILNREIMKRGSKYDSTEEVGRVDLIEGTSPATPEENFRICFVGVAPTHDLAQEIHLLWADKDFYAVITVPAAPK